LRFLKNSRDAREHWLKRASSGGKTVPNKKAVKRTVRYQFRRRFWDNGSMTTRHDVRVGSRKPVNGSRNLSLRLASCPVMAPPVPPNRVPSMSSFPTIPFLIHAWPAPLISVHAVSNNAPKFRAGHVGIHEPARHPARFWSAPVHWRFGSVPDARKAAEDRRTPGRCRVDACALQFNTLSPPRMKPLKSTALA
jgi:hypothetical protein